MTRVFDITGKKSGGYAPSQKVGGSHPPALPFPTPLFSASVTFRKTQSNAG